MWNVLEHLLAKIFTIKVDLAAYLVENLLRQANTADVRQSFQS